MTSQKTLARIAGLLYLISSVCFVFAESVRSRIIKPGDSAATVDNIRASVTLFRVGFMIDLVSGAIFLFTAMALYLLLKHVNQLVAAAMVIFVVLSVAVAYLNLLNQYAALTIATHADYTKAFGQAGSAALVMLFADMQRNGLVIDEMFWGLWLLPLGYLVIKSGYFPKVLGALLIVGCFSWLAVLFVRVLAPDLARLASFLVVGAIGELIFIIWLLVKGVSVPVQASPRAADV
jgi:hypothetical protein